MIAEIQRMAESGELFENSQPLDLDELSEEDPEFAQKLSESLSTDQTAKRNLQ
jgi:hypothetical protein